MSKLTLLTVAALLGATYEGAAQATLYGAVAPNGGTGATINRLVGNLTTGALSIDAGTVGGNSAYLSLGVGGTATALGVMNYVAGFNLTSSSSPAHIFWVRKTSTSATAAMAILQDGRVGIGGSSSSAPSLLTVQGMVNGVMTHINRVAIDNLNGAAGGGTGCIGFNAAAAGSLGNGVVTLVSNGTQNGGALLWGNAEGDLNFSTFPSTGNSLQSIATSSLGTTVGMRIHGDGKVQVGATAPVTSHPNYKMSVDGEFVAKSAFVTSSGWADFVFEPDYKLMTLPDLEQYLRQHKHLPAVPSAKEVEANGVNLGDMDARLLQSIEELTLHVIELSKQNEQLRSDVAELKAKQQTR